METIINNKQRTEKISRFMRELLSKSDSKSKRELYEEYKDVINQIEPIDLFYLDMYKADTSYDIDEIKDSASKFVNVFHQPLSNSIPEEYDSILFQYFIKENNAIESHLDSLKPYFKNDQIINNRVLLLRGFEKCLEIEKKFIKKENILYPHLEQKLPSTMPLQVLWSLHDDARKTLKDILNELNKSSIDIKELIYLIGVYYYLIYGINQKEMYILLPVANKVISKEQKEVIYNESLEYGYCFIDKLKPAKNIKEENYLSDGVFKTKTGILKLNELNAMLNYLPLDITFVDKEDKVKYFNDRSQRHFPRNPSIIGRLVKHCHPPKSVHIVEKIVDAFKSGEKDSAEFWIEFNKVFLYITYYAVRDSNKNYLGTLEVSQDVTKIRALTGQQRLLDWE